MQQMTHPIPRLLVVGGTGFIGRHTVAEGVRRGWQVTSLSRSAPEPQAAVDGASYIVSDIAQIEMLRPALANLSYNYVVNCGGNVDHRLFSKGGNAAIDAHFKGVQNLVAILDRAPLRSFVNIGSSDEYGDSPSPQSEGLRERPISPYSFGKVAAAHFLQMLHRTEGFPAITLRFFLTYGPGQDERRLLPQVIRGCLRNESFAASQGMQLRDFCYIEDNVTAIFAAFDSSASHGEIINVASGQPVQIRTMIEQIQALIGQGSPQWGKIPYRIGETMRLFADISKARRLLDWSPKTPLADGLKATVEWAKSTML